MHAANIKAFGLVVDTQITGETLIGGHKLLKEWHKSFKIDEADE